jgi:hypothetical protein
VTRIFPGYPNIKEVYSEDGFYKYTYGEFTSISEAKAALEIVRTEFADAFIREINVPVEK